MNLNYSSDEIKEVINTVGFIEPGGDLLEEKCMILVEYKDYQNISGILFKNMLITYFYKDNKMKIMKIKLLDPLNSEEDNIDVIKYINKIDTDKLEKFILRYHIDFELDSNDILSKRVDNVGKMAKKILNLKMNGLI